MAINSIPITYVKPLINYLEQNAFDFQPLMQQAGIPRASLNQLRGSIKLTHYIKLIELISEQIPCDLLAVGIIKDTPLTVHGLLGLLIMCGITLKSALAALMRFYRLQTKLIRLQYQETAQRASITIHPDAHLGAAETFTLQMSLLAITTAKEQLTGVTGSNLLHCACSAQQGAAIEKFLSPNVIKFNQEFYQVSFPISELNLKLKNANPISFEVLQQQCEVALEKIENHQTTASKVVHILAQCQDALPNLAQMAKLLTMSNRTLSRHLQQQKTSYQALLEQERIKRAKHLLLYTDMSVTDIAYSLHFTDSSYFTKVFKQHTQQTPAQWRHTA